MQNSITYSVVLTNTYGGGLTRVCLMKLLPETHYNVASAHNPRNAVDTFFSQNIDM